MSEKVFCLRRYFGGRYFGGRYFVREDILAEGILSEKVFRRRRYFVLEGIMSGYQQYLAGKYKFSSQQRPDLQLIPPSQGSFLEIPALSDQTNQIFWFDLDPYIWVA